MKIEYPALALLVSLVAAAPAVAAERVDGPVTAQVVRVIDGDTVEVLAKPWLGMTITTRVRVAGIDTPEKGSRAKCPAEAALAERASAAARAALPAGAQVRISGIAEDKYGGRVVARIADPQGRDVGQALIAAGLARPYDGGRKSSWCR
ncbi:MAG: thermonuclease family protein [Rhodospirillaceae bacterium]